MQQRLVFVLLKQCHYEIIFECREVYIILMCITTRRQAQESLHNRTPKRARSPAYGPLAKRSKN